MGLEEWVDTQLTNSKQKKEEAVKEEKYGLAQKYQGAIQMLETLKQALETNKEGEE